MNGASQGIDFPYFTCGSTVTSDYPRVLVKVRPVALVDSLNISMKVEGEVFGSTDYPVWMFEVLSRYEGFCRDTIQMAVDFGNDSLLAMEELILEFGKMDGAQFALLSDAASYHLPVEEHIDKVHGGKDSRFGKVIDVKREEIYFTLSDLGIALALPDTANYGYDTAIIKDVIFQITFQSEQDTFVAFTRDSAIREVPMFQEGESYLMRLLASKNEKWIVSNHLYRKGFHTDAYFKAYESAH